MRPFTASIALFALSAVEVKAAMGNAFSTGPVADGNFIRVANATLVVPKAAMPQAGLLSLWTGMGTSNGDLIQALVESYHGQSDLCGDLNGDWCSWASALLLRGGDQTQQGGPRARNKVGDEVTLSYMYNAKEDVYDQYVIVNGDVLSSFKSSSGKALGWGTAEECQPDYPCGLVPAHDWINVVLVMDKPDPNYSQTFGNGGSTGTLTTTDGGVTWKGPRIHINEVYFDYPITYDTFSCPGADGSQYTSRSGKNYKVRCGLARRGGDLKKVQIPSKRLADCLVYCEQTQGCIGAILNGTNCFMKSNKNPAVRSNIDRTAAFLIQ